MGISVTAAQAKGVFYILPDHLGTPRAVTNDQNTVVWKNDPLGDPFGHAAPEEDPDGDGQKFTLNLRFPGQYFDAETSTHYNYFRDYDPATGRYVQSDPIGLKGGENTYAYVEGDPVTKTDPKGLWPYHGFWCGPNWTGGKTEHYDPAHEGQYRQPVDGLDSACKTHDMCYQSCRKAHPCDQQKRAQCMTMCDRQLANDAKGAGTWGDSPLWLWMQYNNSPDPGSNASCGCTK